MPLSPSPRSPSALITTNVFGSKYPTKGKDGLYSSAVVSSKVPGANALDATEAIWEIITFYVTLVLCLLIFVTEVRTRRCLLPLTLCSVRF